MSGYDTVVAAVPSTFDRSLAWSKSIETVSGPTVTRRHFASLGEHVTVQHVAQEREGLDSFSLLSVQASLPKVLWGQNVDELEEPLFVAHALGKVQVDLSAFLGATTDLWSWRLQRVDVTCNRRTDDQAFVAAALQRLASVRYRGSLPVRGQHLSVTWPGKKGAYTRTSYSKYDETLDRLAAGVLRGEVRAIGQRAARKSWGVEEDRDVLVADLMTPAAVRARERQVVWMERVMGAAVENVPMEVIEAVEKLKKVVRRDSAAVRLMGFAVMCQLVGEDYLVKSGMLTRQAVWLAKRDFELAGVDPYEIEFPATGDELAAIVEDELDQFGENPAKFTAESLNLLEEIDQEPVRSAADLADRVSFERSAVKKQRRTKAS